MALLDVVDDDVRVLGLKLINQAGQHGLRFPEAPVGDGYRRSGNFFGRSQARQNKSVETQAN